MTIQNTIELREGSYEIPETIIDKDVEIQPYNDENVVFDGTRPISELRDTNSPDGDWKKITKTIVTDNNENAYASLYKIKLRDDVDIWQLFLRRKEIINARWPSAQWTDDSVFDQNRWGHGYYNHSDVQGTNRDYDNGSIIDIPNTQNGNDLYEFVKKLRIINSSFDISGSLINLNVGSFKSYTKVVNTYTMNHVDNFITLTYDPVTLWKTKHHYYYLENKLEFLNTENEWFFNKDTKYLYVWLPNNEKPNLTQIRAKVQSYTLNIQNKGVTVSNINFFGTTFKVQNTHSVRITNCNFIYPSCYAHMLREINRGTPIDPLNNEVFDQNTRIINSTKCMIDNCVFKYVDGSVLEITGGNNTLDNNYISYVDKTVCNISSVMTTLRFGGENNKIRRNTIHKTAASSTVSPGDKSIVEYNNISETGYLQSDGGTIHLMVAQQTDAKVRYNWVHDTIKYGIRFDGEGDSYGGYIHHNIGWNCEGGIMVKGGIINSDTGESYGGHFIYNNTFLNSVGKNDLMIMNEQSGNPINYGTVVLNNLAETISGHRSDAEALESRIINLNNFTTSELEPYFESWENKDFTPDDDVQDVVNNVIGKANTTYTSSSFSPSGEDSLTQDIGAMLTTDTWKAGITWNNTNSVSYTHLRAHET